MVTFRAAPPDMSTILEKVAEHLGRRDEPASNHAIIKLIPENIVQRPSIQDSVSPAFNFLQSGTGQLFLDPEG